MNTVSCLMALVRWLGSSGYLFVTASPATHERVNARVAHREARCLTDIFGWSRPFDSALLPAEIMHPLAAGGLVVRDGTLWWSTVRVSSLDGGLYVHSSFPTTDEDAVFFGPDTYRFAALVREIIGARPTSERATILDVGSGTGVGGIVAHRANGGRSRLILSDISARALDYARANAAFADVDAAFIESDLFAGIDKKIDRIVANPPYLADAKARLYRNGGGRLGSGLSLRIARECAGHLNPGGVLVLYTGSCIVDGNDLLRRDLLDVARAIGAAARYREIDPDVFGEELEQPGYDNVDRIAAVSFVMTLPGGA